MAGSRLEKSRNIVTIYDVDLMNLTLSMELYQMNLREWMGQNKKHSKSNDRFFILHEILVGLNEIHGRGLVHGDIKPGNILINDNPLKVALGDLGFLSVARYAKIQYTARVYRDPAQKSSYVHDMYSLGIIVIELFGKTRVRHVSSTKELVSLAKRKLSSLPKMLPIVRRLLNPNPSHRPTAEQLLDELFKETVYIVPLEVPTITDSAFCAKAISKMRDIAAHYKLARVDRCIQALQYYAQTHVFNKDVCMVYGICMLLISSSIFRISKFSLSKALRYSEMSIEDFLMYYCEILANNDIIGILL
jgi:serine/threonine protein kinase